MYTFMRLLFANTKLDMATKQKFLGSMQTFDENAVKILDEMLDSQGGFTNQAAARHRRELGTYNDTDLLQDRACYAMIRDFDHKKQVFQKMLTQKGYTVKSLEVAGEFIYTGLNEEQLAELADMFYQSIETVFQ